MSRPLSGALGLLMSLEDYYGDFKRNFASTTEFWKLERGQEFAEPGDASWEAFDRGDWEESMRLLEKRRADLVAYHREVAAAGTRTRRIRIVSFPLTPYLQWELNVLKVRDETGGLIRVLPGEGVCHLEDQAPLPEIYTMDDRVMYQAIYDEKGVLEAARRFDDRALIRRCREFIADLYRQGERISEFFCREVAHLSPARPPRPTVPPDYLEEKGRPGPIRS